MKRVAIIVIGAIDRIWNSGNFYIGIVVTFLSAGGNVLQYH